MPATFLSAPEVKLLDKRALQKEMARLNARIGFVKKPNMTPEKVRAMMIAGGIRPEDNAGSREIARMKYEADHAMLE